MTPAGRSVISVNMVVPSTVPLTCDRVGPNSPIASPIERGVVGWTLRHQGVTAMTSVSDSHDLIRVHGARVNNLKDVSVEIPKRRLTVFTGVSGSGKSSLVCGTIAAES